MAYRECSGTKSSWSHQRFEASNTDPLLRLADVPATVECKTIELEDLLASNSVILRSTLAGKSASLSNKSIQHSSKSLDTSKSANCK